MPRVLHVITGLAVGGAEMALYRLIVNSRGSIYTHAVVALTADGAMRQRFREAGVELDVFDFKSAPISHFFRLILLIRKIRPDIVQTWMYHADLLGGLAAFLAGARNVIWGVHSTNLVGSGRSGTTRIARRLCAWLSGMVPRAIVCVAETSKRAHAEIGYDAGRMVVVPNGFELSQLVASAEQRSLLRAQCGIGEGEVVIGSLGRFNPVKDPHNFVRAAAMLASRYPHVRFLMVGRGLDSGNAELAAWLADTGYRDRFVLLGERSDVPVCLAAMDIFCLHSRTEAFPLVVGEAMAMGLPCVVTNVGDAALIVADSGEVVAKENPISLAQGLARLLDMAPEQRLQMGQKAKARIRAEFTIERSRRHFESIYQRVIREESRH
jgi:glycosyltransferase involved in cell wall biosynthesis